MREAIGLALRGRYHVEPNPRVGALALEEGRVVGRGWHRRWGGAHAEVDALEDAARHDARPDTVVVTLEPCSTPAGVSGKKTPPCTRALLEAGVRRVVVGQSDPDPRHRGRGLAELAEAGVEVVDGVLASRCAEINRPFARWLGLDRPWTILKYAMTLDGKIAARTGEARWISGLEARKRTHALRALSDVVAIGFRTARTDDPELTVRHVEGRQPRRLVVDPRAELSTDSKLVRTIPIAPLTVVVAEDAPSARVEALEAAGAEVLRAPLAESGRRLHLLEVWRALRRGGVRRVLVEGGGGLAAELLGWGCADQVAAFVAPKIVGGQDAPTPVEGEGRAFMAEAWRLEELGAEPCGEDLAIGAFFS